MVQLSLVALSLSTLSALPASARLDRRSTSHRAVAHSANLEKREPFRLFEKSDSPSEGSFASSHDGIVALKKRADGSDLLASIGDAVSDVAVAWHLAPVDDKSLAAPVVLAQKQANDTSAAKKRTAAAAEAKKKQVYVSPFLSSVSLLNDEN
jgi:hypothetical protein